MMHSINQEIIDYSRERCRSLGVTEESLVMMYACGVYDSLAALKKGYIKKRFPKDFLAALRSVLQ